MGARRSLSNRASGVRFSASKHFNVGSNGCFVGCSRDHLLSIRNRMGAAMFMEPSGAIILRHANTCGDQVMVRGNMEAGYFCAAPINDLALNVFNRGILSRLDSGNKRISVACVVSTGTGPVDHGAIGVSIERIGWVSVIMGGTGRRVGGVVVDTTGTTVGSNAFRGARLGTFAVRMPGSHTGNSCTMGTTVI